MGEDGGLIAGHARILAARQLGIAEIPVMVAAGWPSALRAADGAVSSPATNRSGRTILLARKTELHGALPPAYQV